MVELFRLAGVTLCPVWFRDEFEDLIPDGEEFYPEGGPLDPALEVDRQAFLEILDDAGGHRLSNEDLERFLRLLPS